jgi:magnesium-transporting ATPase (P-type)
LKWRDVLSVWNTPAESRKNNAGMFLLGGVGVLMGLLTLLTFVLPLVTWSSNKIQFRSGLYFLAIGLAFMMVETVLVQKGVLFLGHPTYSFPTVLCALLVGAGAGSAWTQRVRDARLKEELSRSLIALLIGMIAIILALPVWLNAGFRFSLPARIFWLGVPLLILGALMGRLFPLGLRTRTDKELPWAWALNGSASVLGSIVAVVLAMQLGFAAVLWSSLALYAFAALCAFRWL